MTEELRFSLPGDEDGLKNLWRAVFQDGNELIDSFFSGVYSPGMAALLAVDGQTVSAAYNIKLGELAFDGRWTPCRLIYAAGTMPEYRGRGYGGRTAEKALDLAGAGLTAIVPSEPWLFTRYEKLGFQTAFRATVEECTDVGLKLSGTVTRVTVRGYAALREELLYGAAHIDLDMRLLDFQEFICSHSGGGFYYVVSEGTRCCAAAEVRDGRAYISELIVPSGSRYNAAALVARALRVKSFTYRSPARSGEDSVPFAMLHAHSPVKLPTSGWFGFAFD